MQRVRRPALSTTRESSSRLDCAVESRPGESCLGAESQKRLIHIRSSTLVRQFSPEYLDRTRRGLWDDRAALDPLALSSREHVVDVGCGSGSLSQVIAEEAPQARLTAIDADPALLQVARERGTQSILAGDGTRLPLQSDVADLVACQALLVNLAEPANAVAEFVRVST
ncbi:MAG: methylase involved in ubiquinone/menaquinone biosynthesis, partial [Halorubrum sp. J07HR59]